MSSGSFSSYIQASLSDCVLLSSLLVFRVSALNHLLLLFALTPNESSKPAPFASLPLLSLLSSCTVKGKWVNEVECRAAQQQRPSAECEVAISSF